MLRKKNFVSIRTLLFGSFVTGVLLYIFLLGIQNIFSYYTHQATYQNLLKQYSKEHARNQAFKESLSALELDAFWDREIRERLGYIRQGETVYKFYKGPVAKWPENAQRRIWTKNDL